MSLKYAILGLLTEEPYYGYEIKQQFESIMGELWPVSYGQLYPTLRSLTQSGLVTRKTVQGKKAIEKNVYSITQKGSTLFKEWLLKEKKRTQNSIKDEFTLSLFFIHHLPQDVVFSLLYEHLVEVEHQYDSCKAGYEELNENTPFYKRALTKKMMLLLEAEKEWLIELKEEFRLKNRMAAGAYKQIT